MMLFVIQVDHLSAMCAMLGGGGSLAEYYVFIETSWLILVKIIDLMYHGTNLSTLSPNLCDLFTETFDNFLASN